MRAWKALFRAIGIVATGFLLAMILRPPKLDEAIKYNSPTALQPPKEVIASATLLNTSKTVTSLVIFNCS